MQMVYKKMHIVCMQILRGCKKYSLRSASRGATLVDTRPEPDDGARSAWSESGERGSAAAGGSGGAARVCDEEMCA